MPTDMQRCIQDCVECAQICVQTVQHCLEKGGKHAAPDHIRTLSDCADICGVSARFMLRGSDLHAETCRACSIVCDRCAESCEQMADDEMMRRCAEVCRRCSQSCGDMAGITPGRKVA